MHFSLQVLISVVSTSAPKNIMKSPTKTPGNTDKECKSISEASVITLQRNPDFGNCIDPSLWRKLSGTNLPPLIESE